MHIDFSVSWFFAFPTICNDPAKRAAEKVLIPLIIFHV